MRIRAQIETRTRYGSGIGRYAERSVTHTQVTGSSYRIMLQDQETGSSSRTLSAEAGAFYGSRFWSAARAGPGSGAGRGSTED